MVTIAIYKPVFRSLEDSLTDDYVKDHKRELLNHITVNCKRKTVVDFLKDHFYISYSDGFSHKNISFFLDKDCHNERLKMYSDYIKKYYGQYLHDYPLGRTPRSLLPVDLVYEATGDFATRHFYNRPCTLFMAFNRAKAGSLINYWIKPKYRDTFLKKLDEVWEAGMIMEIVF